jgi:hypothetical protein
MPPLNDSAPRVRLTDVWSDRPERQRREIKTDDIEASISLRGVLQAIIVLDELGPNGQPYKLVAGERRLEASRRLGLDSIPFRLFADLDPIEAQIIELEENIKRSDLDWQDLVRAVGRIHGLYQGRNPQWTGVDTAEACAITKGTVSLYLTVFERIGEERIVTSATVREAYNILQRRDDRAAGDALQELLEAVDKTIPLAEQEAPPAVVGQPQQPGGIPGSRLAPAAPAPLRVEDSILHESFTLWAPNYSGKRFNFVHCDFPYGINLFAGPQAGAHRHEGGYEDSPDLYFQLLVSFCDNLDRFMALSSHLMFWYSAKHHDETMRVFRERAPNLVFHPYPLIWVKSDNAGIASDPSRTPRHVYETALFASRGGRPIVKIVTDAYSAPANGPDKNLHPSAKPEPMLRHFMSMIVDETTSIFDPTCGCGSSLRAAESLGAFRSLGMDVDERSVALARTALKNARGLRQASREVA